MIFETLEKRQMMSVSAQVVGGILVVIGDAGANVITVADQGANTFEVISGADDTTFANVTNGVLVASGGGDDTVFYDSSFGSVSPLALGAAVFLGDGNDTINVTLSDAGNRLSIDGGAGQDVIIASAFGGASLAFSGGANSDGGSVQAYDGATVTVNAGSGDDRGRGNENTGFTLEAYAGTVVYDGGAGNDVVTATAFGSGSTFVLSGGDGDDQFVGLSVQPGSVGYVYGGNGNDSIQVNDVQSTVSYNANGDPATLDGKIYIWGENGNDAIRLFSVSGLAFVYGGNGNDTVSTGDPLLPGGDADVSGHLTFDGGAGRDLLVTALSQSSAKDHLTLLHVEKVSPTA